MRRPTCPQMTAIAPAVALVLMISPAAGCSAEDPGTDERPSPAQSSTSTNQGEAPLEVEADGLPAAFPREDVSLVEGDVVSVSEPNDGNRSYTLVVTVAVPPAEAVAQAVGVLEDEGWVSKTDLTGGPPAPQVLSLAGGEATQVIITNTGEGEMTNLTYSVMLAD